MPDPFTPQERSAVMRAVKGKDTAPEMIVRRLVHRLGYRYRLHAAELPGKPDLVFPSRRKVIFVHGCFWHWHNCKRGRRMPKSNSGYWAPKLQRNQERDRRHRRALRRGGWGILIVWECQLKNLDRVTERIRAFLAEDAEPPRQAR
jgi:DNA mismatch endonuclease, patch repair protein